MPSMSGDTSFGGAGELVRSSLPPKEWRRLPWLHKFVESEIVAWQPERTARAEPHVTKGRGMIRWTLTYLACAWLVLQLVDVLKDIWQWPLPVQRFVCSGLALGILPSLVVAWFHGERGRQDVSRLEVLLLAASLLVACTVLWLLFAP